MSKIVWWAVFILLMAVTGFSVFNGAQILVAKPDWCIRNHNERSGGIKWLKRKNWMKESCLKWTAVRPKRSILPNTADWEWSMDRNRSTTATVAGTAAWAKSHSGAISAVLSATGKRSMNAIPAESTSSTLLKNKENFSYQKQIRIPCLDSQGIIFYM